MKTKEIIACLSFFFFSNSLFSTEFDPYRDFRGTLEIVKDTCLKEKSHLKISLSHADLRQRLLKFYNEYKQLFPAWEESLKKDFRHGVLVLDLDDNLLKKEQGVYLSSDFAFFPNDLIKGVIDKALEHRMPILLLSSGLHYPLELQKYFKREFNISAEVFRKEFDLIVGSSVDQEKLDRLNKMSSLDETYTSLSSEISSKGRDLIAWLDLYRNNDEEIGKIFVFDDGDFQLAGIKKALEERGLEEKKNFHLINTDERVEGREPLDVRKEVWTEALKLFDSLMFDVSLSDIKPFRAQENREGSSFSRSHSSSSTMSDLLIGVGQKKRPCCR